MQRVLVIGNSGAGKTTFSTELGKLTALPVVHLDKAYWQPGWVQTPKEAWRKCVSELVRQEQWIIDGSFASTLDIRLPRADTVIFLDFPRYRCMYRIFKRAITRYGQVRFDMGEDCPEKFDWEFTKWVWHYRRDQYPLIHARLQQHFAGGNLITPKSPGQAQAFLQQVRGNR